MINAAVVGLGWWGKTLVESAANSDTIRFVAGATRTVTPEVEVFAKKHGLRLLANYDAVLADREIDAVVLATPHSMHGGQVIAAAEAARRWDFKDWLCDRKNRRLIPHRQRHRGVRWLCNRFCGSNSAAQTKRCHSSRIRQGCAENLNFN